MFIREENSEALSEAICSFRDLLLEKNFDDEGIYTSLMLVSNLMYLHWSPCLDEGRREVLKALDLACADVKEQQEITVEKQVDKKMVGTEQRHINNVIFLDSWRWRPYEKKDLNQGVLCDILDFTKFKNIFNNTLKKF